MATENDIVWQLVEGFWKYLYEDPSAGRRKFDVEPGGTLTVNITGLTDEGKFLARHALAAWAEVTGITFRETGSVNAHIIFDDDADDPETPGPDAMSWFDSMSSGTFSGGGIIRQSEINVSVGWLDENGADLNSYSFTTYIHEIGHALGLGHPGDYNGTFGSDNVGQQYEWDARLFTVMSYASEETDNPITAEFALNVFPATPMFYDVEAIWELYGKPPGGVNAGDTIYTSWDVPDVDYFQSLNLVPTTAVTLVDTGGRDTLYLGDTSDIVIFTLEEGETAGLGSINGAPVDDEGRVAFNLVFHGEVENLYGGGGNDVLMGAGADNRLVGEAGDDYLLGWDGDDFLTGNVGDDTLEGGPGADTFVFQPDDDPSRYTDVIMDFDPAQGDRIDLRAYRGITGIPENWIEQAPGLVSSRVMDLDGDGFYDIELAGYTNRLDDDHFIFADGTNSTTTVADGTGEDDWLTGTDGNDRLEGLAGDDLLLGWDGDDHLDGGAGDDFLDGGPGADALVGGTGFDTASYMFSSTGVTINLHDGTARGGDAWGDTLGDDIENVWGSAYDDVLTGTDSLTVGNVIYGWAGNDELYGGWGDDFLFGGEGSDILSGGDEDDILEGGPGADVLMGGLGDDAAAYEDSAAGVTVRLHSLHASGGDAEGDTWGDRVTVSYTRNGLTFQETVPDIINLFGSDHDDVLAGDSRDNTLVGWDGNDKLYGGPGGGDDELYGERGDDSLYGGLGHDILFGGEGNDILSGGHEDDILVGGPGADVLVGGLGHDTAEYSDSATGVTVRLHSLHASGGSAEGDTWGRLVTVSYTRDGLTFQETVPDIINLFGSDHDDVLAGDSRDNTLVGWDGNDKIYGGPGGGNDRLFGERGDDTLYGGSGYDFLDGGRGNDSLFGGLEDDFLVGGPDYDRLVGGQGADSFMFEPGDTLEFNDVIADFNPAQGDRIVLSGYEVASFQDRYWIGDGSADTYVDLDGNGWSDIVLTGYTEPLPDHYFVFI